MRKITRYLPFLIPSLLLLVFLVTPEVVSANVVDDIVKKLEDVFLSIFWSVVVGLTGIVLWMGGLVFDYGINSFVLGFADTFQNSGIGLAVDGVWITIRDFVNLTFIFGLVYIGFKMILDSNDSNTRRWLINLIMAALLLNFSLFISKAVVDFSNQISSQIAISGFGAVDGENVTGNTIKRVDISGQFLKIVGAPRVLKNGAVTEGGRPENAGVAYIIGVGITFLIAGFVLFSGGLLLLIRFALLNLFFILSPIMFVGWIIPALSRFSKDYWDRFLKQAFFAPAYFLMLYIAMEILKALATALSGSPGFNDMQTAFSSTASGSGLSPIPFFILSSIFMVSALTIAQKIGADGSAMTLNVAHSVRKKVQRGGQFVAANTAGRYARGKVEKLGSATERRLRQLQQIEGNGKLARFTRAAARSNGAESVIGGAATSMQKAKFGMSRTVEEDKKMRAQTDKRANNAMTISRGLSAKELNGRTWASLSVDEQKKYAHLYDQNLRDANNNLIPPDQQIASHIAKMKKEAAEMSIKDFEAMSEDQQEQIAEFLSGSQTDSIMKSDNISDEQKGKIENAQKAAIEKMVTENGVILGEKLADLSIRQIETLGEDFINKNAHLFTDSQFSELKKSKKFTEGQVNGFGDNRKNNLKNITANNPDDVFKVSHAVPAPGGGSRIAYKDKKASEIAKLPGDVLSSANATQYLTVDILKNIASSDKEFARVSTQQRETILNHLERVVLQTPGTPDPTLAKALDYLHSPKGQGDFLGK